jgi:hypothetical protein
MGGLYTNTCNTQMQYEILDVQNNESYRGHPGMTLCSLIGGYNVSEEHVSIFSVEENVNTQLQNTDNPYSYYTLS